MSNEMLSQDEIDALLRGSDDISEDLAPLNIEDHLSEMEKDALGEIGNISFGSSATALSTLLNQKVDITTPTVSLIFRSQLAEEFPQPNVAIQVNYTKGFSGENLLVIKQSDAAIIADLMLGGDGINPAEMLGEIQLSAVQEAMNQMMGSSATSMSTIFNKRVDISPPTVDLLNIQQGEGTEKLPNQEMMVKVSFRLKIGSLVDSTIMQLLPLDFAKSLVNELLNPSMTPEPEQAKMPNSAIEPQDMFTQSQQMDVGQPYNQMVNQNVGGSSVQNTVPYTQPTNQYAPSNPEQQTKQSSGPQHFGAPIPQGIQPNVQPAMFSNFEPVQLQDSEAKNLDILLDIPLQVTVQLGKTTRTVKEILELSPGSIIELDKLAGEPVDILINNRPIAKGEVVVIDENFGVRVTDILSQSDRLKRLK
ncbi:flagellar motor switch phosphatase FliY [Niallia sp. Krafla_26]|uniref:flagellar motor switch phosphatase FliY n=1 Tax=Niallia sp. Krafla_26 TaxID=3064703 RepID=UPI003D177694